MKRVILDTSVYGKFVDEPEIADMVLKRVPEEFVIYGTETIKKELRETPKHLIHKGKKLRIILLSFYGAFIRKSHHDLSYNKLVETLTKDYLLEYKRKGGVTPSRKLKNDFTIIATATIYKLDIVISDDEETMLSPLSIETYQFVNKKYGMPDPVFKKYRAFREELLKNQEERPL